MKRWEGKRVLITGVCGTIGKALLELIALFPVEEIVGIDNNESELFYLSVEYARQPKVKFFLGDIRDRAKIMQKTEKVDIVLHVAALKHVILCEHSPMDAIQTNIQGVQNIIDAALANGVERVLFTSSDKAVNPTNVMGTSKLMGERLITAANALRRGTHPIFASIRFGNVLGSRGSVIPIFRKQIEEGATVTLTDPAMTRFVMTLAEAVKMVVDTVFMAEGGEVFVTKMHVVKIQDLAEVMIEELAPLYRRSPKDITIGMIGAKSGEKLYEELMNDEETRRTVKLENYFMVMPAFRSLYGKAKYAAEERGAERVDVPYSSARETPMTKKELKDYLAANTLLVP